LLTACGVARVAADPAPWPGADHPGGSKSLAYFRWHGSPHKYYSDYDATRLAALQSQLADAAVHASDVWVIFDNTVLGHALSNAMSIQDGLKTRPRASRARRRNQAPSKNPIFTPAS